MNDVPGFTYVICSKQMRLRYRQAGQFDAIRCVLSLDSPYWRSTIPDDPAAVW
jgi:hypothetical protein